MKLIVTLSFFCGLLALLPTGMQGIVLKGSKLNATGAGQQPPTGEMVFKKYCMTCHQADAGGVPNLNPPLIQTKWVLGDKKQLIKIVLNGFNEGVEIDGEYFSNPMPALNILSDQEIAAVLTYVRSNFGNKAPAVTSAEVKSVRAKIK